MNGGGGSNTEHLRQRSREAWKPQFFIPRQIFARGSCRGGANRFLSHLLPFAQLRPLTYSGCPEVDTGGKVYTWQTPRLVTLLPLYLPSPQPFSTSHRPLAIHPASLGLASPPLWSSPPPFFTCQPWPLVTRASLRPASPLPSAPDSSNTALHLSAAKLLLARFLQKI